MRALGRRLPLAIPMNERLLVAVAQSKAAVPLTASSGQKPTFQPSLPLASRIACCSEERASSLPGIEVGRRAVILGQVDLGAIAVGTGLILPLAGAQRTFDEDLSLDFSYARGASGLRI